MEPHSLRAGSLNDKQSKLAMTRACRLLKESGIPCYLWAEDALAYYGVPTVVFDVHIVVGDVKKAADALVERGWHPPPPESEARYIDIEEATC
ncbi:hypothetical protein N7530_011406 [Penicillium desertorum]|uniref:Uncharacterized protein n=1 Tax=Penicillium desertorum TaxID=1303715 RepID=A0A9W9WH64_9EURO|nr:hypothetical protein N7530_011406 [Penicillium desertorum]